ncbi:uncharacterized protein LOC113005448 isoform X2 [Solenopsis invicta]|uniref:uncharacterized protein LOC113005448 isoform X2 n=1 Tax=Solenopsis invicta TaxID=13686 RepID=UPI000E33E04B|nr:uncharacterized protein LOC113005448 isoform X2 [Solenopsis invicta]XP_039302972.1 uncharacterized protein LOC113005448 isoform X2 [Solenopsis invicta]XP_039302973.1 uncharacterized protein LOC113005448 isoform X2 [Solenopsis invicta]XP_039302974.1 uncharacterized protein LOC113005448 isoform X2 [Solenopsis invicta]
MNKRRDENQRRFNIWFKINDNDPIKITDLKISTYVRLKNFDNDAFNFILQKTNCQNITSLWKSVDDVNYTRVKIPSGRLLSINHANYLLAVDSSKWLTCKNCSENINSLDMVPKHKCFIGEEVFMDGNQMLFKVENADDTEYNHIANNNKISATEQNDIKKSNAVWNKHSTLAVLFNLVTTPLQPYIILIRWKQTS